MSDRSTPEAPVDLIGITLADVRGGDLFDFGACRLGLLSLIRHRF